MTTPDARERLIDALKSPVSGVPADTLVDAFGAFIDERIKAAQHVIQYQNPVNVGCGGGSIASAMDCALTRDVTTHKQQVESLQRENAELQRLYENAHANRMHADAAVLRLESELAATQGDPRPLCIQCRKPWVPDEGEDATDTPCRPCRTKKECEHVWEEGNGRDHGRYHCKLCFRCLYPMSVVSENKQLRAQLQQREGELAEAKRPGKWWRCPCCQKLHTDWNKFFVTVGLNQCDCCQSQTSGSDYLDPTEVVLVLEGKLRKSDGERDSARQRLDGVRGLLERWVKQPFPPHDVRLMGDTMAEIGKGHGT